METVYRNNGNQSMPFNYDDAKAGALPFSETTMTINGNWTIGAPQTLVVWFMGNLTNQAQTMFARVNNSKALYSGPATDITVPKWKQWNINLASLGTNLADVKTLGLGFEKIGATSGTGLVFFDDIRLYREAPALPLEEIWIEAEPATTITTPFAKCTEVAGASGGQYIGKADGTGNNTTPVTDGSATATYTFTVTGGTYMLNLRYYTYGSGFSFSNGFWVKMPDATCTILGTGAAVVLNNGWIDDNSMNNNTGYFGWDYVRSAVTPQGDVLFAIPAGTHTLSISNRDDGTMLDVIVLEKISN